MLLYHCNYYLIHIWYFYPLWTDRFCILYAKNIVKYITSDIRYFLCEIKIDFQMFMCMINLCLYIGMFITPPSLIHNMIFECYEMKLFFLCEHFQQCWKIIHTILIDISTLFFFAEESVCSFNLPSLALALTSPQWHLVAKTDCPFLSKCNSQYNLICDHVCVIHKNETSSKEKTGTEEEEEEGWSQGK